MSTPNASWPADGEMTGQLKKCQIGGQSLSAWARLTIVAYDFEWYVQGKADEHDPVVDFVPRSEPPS